MRNDKLTTLEANLKALKLTPMEDVSNIKSNYKMKLKDEHGYLYSLSNQNLLVIKRRNTTPAMFFNYNPYTYENINLYFSLNNIDLELLETNPKMAKIPMLFRCTKHNKEFMRSWNAVSQDIVGCDVCTGVHIHTYDDIVRFVKSKGNTFLSNEYKGVHHEYLFKCGCGNEFNRRIDVFMYQGVVNCNECNGITVNTYESIKDRLAKHDIQLLSTNYINIRTKLKVKYKCGFECERSFTDIERSNYICPHCNKVGYKRNTNQLREEVHNSTNGEYMLMSDYVNMNTKVKIKHLTCGAEYSVTPHSFLDSKNRCPLCRISKGEQAIRELLIQWNKKFIHQHSYCDCVSDIGKKLVFDFAVFNEDNTTTLIEYDGEFHYHNVYSDHDLEGQQRRDRIKNEYCKNKGIKLIRIPYWDLNNIEEILTRQLRTN